MATLSQKAPTQDDAPLGEAPAPGSLADEGAAMAVDSSLVDAKSAALVELLNVRRTTDVLTKHTPSERVPAVWGIIVERLQVSGRP